MRMEGRLVKWNDERGFGFVSPAQGGSEVFVHVSAFPADGLRPRIGERLSFEIETGRDGKLRATRLVCLDRQVRHSPRHDLPASRRASPRGGVRFLRLAVVVALLAFVYAGYSRLAVPKRAVAAPEAAQTAATDFRCDGRTLCSEMKSCAEATFFLQNCPDVKMDGNRDGVPCEQQWCVR